MLQMKALNRCAPAAVQRRWRLSQAPRPETSPGLRRNVAISARTPCLTPKKARRVQRLRSPLDDGLTLLYNGYPIFRGRLREETGVLRAHSMGKIRFSVRRKRWYRAQIGR